MSSSHYADLLSTPEITMCTLEDDMCAICGKKLTDEEWLENVCPSCMEEFSNDDELALACNDPTRRYFVNRITDPELDLEEDQDEPPHCTACDSSNIIDSGSIYECRDCLHIIPKQSCN